MSDRYSKKCGTCKNYMSKIMCPIESKGRNTNFNSPACDEYNIDDLFSNAYRWRRFKQCNWLEDDNGRERP